MLQAHYQAGKAEGLKQVRVLLNEAIKEAAIEIIAAQGEQRDGEIN
jgi:ABC-type dipeptide/oligopeptide/nickel transport system permease component